MVGQPAEDVTPPTSAVVRAAGHDLTPASDELHHYWTLTRGEGRAQWAGSPEPWTTLEHLLDEHYGPEQAKRMAAAERGSTSWPGGFWVVTVASSHTASRRTGTVSGPG